MLRADSNTPTSRLAPGALPDNRPAPARRRIGRVRALLRSWEHGPDTALPTELPEHECSGRDSNPRPVDESITGTVPARNRRNVAVVKRGRRAESNRNGTECTLSPDNRAAPARDGLGQQARQDSNPDRRGWSSPCSRYTTDLRSLRQESNPHLGRTKGACLPLTLGGDGDGGSRTRSSSVQTRCSAARASSPRCGRMDSNHHSTRQRVYSARSSPMLSVRSGG
jgi:hypothetical protein